MHHTLHGLAVCFLLFSFNSAADSLVPIGAFQNNGAHYGKWHVTWCSLVVDEQHIFFSHGDKPLATFTYEVLKELPLSIIIEVHTNDVSSDTSGCFNNTFKNHVATNFWRIDYANSQLCSNVPKIDECLKPYEQPRYSDKILFDLSMFTTLEAAINQDGNKQYGWRRYFDNQFVKDNFLETPNK